MRVKICGITNLEDALLSCRLGADALGFVFYEKSKRYIDYNNAEKIIKGLPPFIVKVGVFVHQEADEINYISQRIRLNAVQIYNNEDISFVGTINLPVIKSFRVGKDFDFHSINEYEKCSFLLDTYSEKAIGGTGETFDWELIPHNLRSKIILAGGVSMENIEHIFKNIKPLAVDVSSSLESSYGKKDANKLKEFFKIINYLRYISC